MSQSLAWVSRGVGFVCVGLATILTTLGAHDTRLLVIQIAGYAVIGLTMLVWARMEAGTPANTAPGPRLAVGLGIVCAIAGGISATHDGALTVVLAAIAALVAGSDTPLVPALSVTSAGILGFVAGAVLSGTSNAGELIGLPATIVAGLLLGLHRRTYRVQAEQSAELLARTQQVQDLRRRADVLDERTRIAREIHDVLAHSLGGLGIQIQAARAVLTDHQDVDKALDVLGTAQRLVSEGLTETRRALHALRSDTLSLDEELRNLAEKHGGLHGGEVSFVVEGTPRELPAAASMALLRVAQEAMVNAAKHASGKPIDLRLEYADDRVRMTVANPPAQGASAGSWLQTADAGYGLAGMRERLLLIGGTLHAGPRGDTWTVAAELPHAPIRTEG